MKDQGIEPSFDFGVTDVVQPPSPRAGAGLTVSGLVLGVGGGILLAVLVLGLIGALAARQESLRVREALAAHQAAFQTEQQRFAEEQQRIQREQAEKARSMAHELAGLQRQQEADRQAAQAEQQRRAAAWASFYQVPKQCVGVASVECANDYIRAKRAFEAAYKPGQTGGTTPSTASASTRD